MDKRNRKKKTVDDTVCEIHKFSGYAVLSNCFVRSTKLGCPAIGLLGRVMDLPPTWNFSKAGLIALCPDGETAIDSALKSLKECGYLEIEVKMPNENPTGRIQTVYKFYEYSAKDTSIPQYDYELETFTVDNAVLNRVKKVGNFTMISSKLLRNKEIPNKLLGFLLKVLSLPDYWHFSMSGLKAICKEGKTAVHNAVNKLIDMGYLVRTQLLSNESIHNCFEYVYSFFDDPVSKEEADELDAETRRKAITIREGGRTKAAVSSSGEKQRVENPYPDNPPAESPLSENQGQYNNNKTLQKNQLLSDKSSIIPAATKSTFNIPNVEKLNDEYMKARNARLFELASDYCICYWNPKGFRSGTGQTVRMAQKKGIEVINLFESASNSVISPVSGLTDSSNSVIIELSNRSEVSTMPRKKKTETAPVAEVKAEVVTEAVKETAAEAPAEKPAAKKAPAKKTATKAKTPAKAAEKKTTAKTTTKTAAKTTRATAPVETVKVQFGGDEYDFAEIKKAVEVDYKKKFKAKVKTIEFYIKPEDKAVYYVINGDFSDKIEL